MDLKGKILVIDDEVGIRKGCRRVLEPAGFSVETAASFREGLQKIQQESFDLILLDVMMPDGRGIDLIGPILERDPETVTVIITGYATVELAVETIKRGAYDFISKPFMADVLLMTVEQGLEKRRLSLEARRLQTIEQQAAELTRARDQAEKLNEFKSSFATMVAHELRSPVSGAQSLVRTLSRGLAGEVNPQQKEMLVRIETRLDFLLSLINDLLTLAASKSLETDKPLERVNVGVVLKTVLDRFADEAKNKQIALNHSTPEQELTVSAQENGLDSILRNLVGNAIKYTPEKGTVTVDVLVEGECALLRVKDTGIGIPADELSHLGEEFFRAKNAHAAGVPGTGLGMSIVKQYVEQYQGQIGVESEVGKGTTFTVRLPLWKE
ncbi:MAG TPA: ATP-binding protein [Anaerolineales bacterium]|nr:ATP-binding protein [Anaerolineales bacterium]